MGQCRIVMADPEWPQYPVEFQPGDPWLVAAWMAGWEVVRIYRVK